MTSRVFYVDDTDIACLFHFPSVSFFLIFSSFFFPNFFFLQRFVHGPIQQLMRRTHTAANCCIQLCMRLCSALKGKRRWHTCTPYTHSYTHRDATPENIHPRTYIPQDFNLFLCTSFHFSRFISLICIIACWMRAFWCVTLVASCTRQATTPLCHPHRLPLDPFLHLQHKC